MVRWNNPKIAKSGLILASAIVIGMPAHADEFALSVSPPRFELSEQPGQTVRAVAELSNASNTATQLNFATAEWDLTPDGGVTISDALKPNSCRPWVAIERHQTTLQAKEQLRYRFEVIHLSIRRRPNAVSRL